MTDKHVQPLYTIEGDGLTDVFKSILEKFFPKRAKGILPPKVRALLARIGNEKITSLKIVRTPIQSTLYTILNLVTLNAFKDWIQRNGYDAVFHLSVFINNKYLLEKNQVINMESKSPVKKGSEIVTVSIPPNYNKSIIEVLNTTREQMGDNLFTSYDPWLNNCQDFVTAFMKASGLLTQDIEKFIKQPVEDLVQRIPSFVQKFGSNLVDLAARVDRAVQGEGLDKDKDKRTPEQKYKSCVTQVSETQGKEAAIPICKASVLKQGIINKVKKRMKELKVPFKTVEASAVKGKRFLVTLKDGTKVNFGSDKATTYLDDPNEAKRKSYLARASKQVNKNGQRLIDIKYSPSWMNYYVVWSGSD